jgi:hypothetical protein
VTVVVAVCVPYVPVTVTVYCPVVAVLLAVKVRELFEVVGLGENEAVTPVGTPETERFTLPVKPYCGLTLTYVLTDVPWPILTYPPPYSVNVGTKIPNVRVVALVWLPYVPVIVSGYCPTAAVLLAVNVSVLFPVVGFGEKEAVTPVGSPDTERFTLPVNPYCGFT